MRPALPTTTVVVLLQLLLATFAGLAAAHGPEAGDGSNLGFGYIGMPSEGMVDDTDMQAFRHRVMEEAYAKAEGDKVRLWLIALGVLLVHLAAARVGRLVRWLDLRFDVRTLGTVADLLLVGLVIPTGLVVAMSYNPSSWRSSATSTTGLRRRS